MRRLIGAIAVFAVLWMALILYQWHDARAQVGPPNQVLCNQFINFRGSGAAARIIRGAGKPVYICGWHVTSPSATTTTFQLPTGTGTNCGTNTVNVTPALNVPLSAPSADHIDWASLSEPL